MTEDMLEEQAEILTQLGTSEEGARVRAQMQCASLLSDMEAFKVSERRPLMHYPADYSSSDLERVSIECRKTKTKVITLVNQKGRRQSSKPILEVITRSRHKERENVHARATIGFGFTSDWLKKWHENFEPISEWSNAKPKQFVNYFRHSIENRSKKNVSALFIVKVHLAVMRLHRHSTFDNLKETIQI